MKNNFTGLISILFTVLFFSAVVFSQTTEFTYQGRLLNASAPAGGNHDFEFALYDAVSGGVQIGSTLTRASVAVADGSFSVKLDFGNNFPGANRFLEIHVRQTGGGAFTPLTPRQQINSTPYSVQSLNATNATNAVNAGNFTGNLTGDVTGTQGATVVTTVGGQSAANVANASQSVNTATSNNTANTLVRRDASGNFIDGTITGNLAGNASTATNAAGAVLSQAVTKAKTKADGEDVLAPQLKQASATVLGEINKKRSQ